MQIQHDVKVKIFKHLKSCVPQEGVGFLLKSGEYIPCENLAGQTLNTKKAPDINSSFQVSSRQYIKYARDIQAVVHSHIAWNGQSYIAASATDLLTRKAMDVPWIIYTIGPDGSVLHEDII